ncbi:hypothetical protein ACOMHN_002533 [Nucella lapillus]
MAEGSLISLPARPQTSTTYLPSPFKSPAARALPSRLADGGQVTGAARGSVRGARGCVGVTRGGGEGGGHRWGLMTMGLPDGATRWKPLPVRLCEGHP